MCCQAALLGGAAARSGSLLAALAGAWACGHHCFGPGMLGGFVMAKLGLGFGLSVGLRLGWVGVHCWCPHLHRVSLAPSSLALLSVCNLVVTVLDEETKMMQMQMGMGMGGAEQGFDAAKAYEAVRAVRLLHSTPSPSLAGSAPGAPTAPIPPSQQCGHVPNRCAVCLFVCGRAGVCAWVTGERFPATRQAHVPLRGDRGLAACQVPCLQAVLGGAGPTAERAVGY